MRNGRLTFPSVWPLQSEAIMCGKKDKRVKRSVRVSALKRWRQSLSASNAARRMERGEKKKKGWNKNTNLRHRALSGKGNCFSAVTHLTAGFGDKRSHALTDTISKDELFTKFNICSSFSCWLVWRLSVISMDAVESGTWVKGMVGNRWFKWRAGWSIDIQWVQMIIGQVWTRGIERERETKDTPIIEWAGIQGDVHMISRWRGRKSASQK